MPETRIRIESSGQIQRIFIPETFNFQKDARFLHGKVDELILAKKRNFVFDLRHISFPHASFIAYLIELTSRLRREGGDLLLANLSDSASMNFMTFSPFGYLKVSKDGQDGMLAAPAIGLNSADKEPAQGGRQVEESLQENKQFDIKEPGKEPPGSLGVTDKVRTKKEPAGPSISMDLEAETDELGFEDLVEDNPTELRVPESGHIVVHSREDQLYKLTDYVITMAKRAGFDQSEVSRIKISVYEAAANVIEHAYKYDSQNFIELLVKYDSSQFIITLMDKGEGFEFDPDKDYDAVEAAEEKRTGGFGLHIIKRSMDEVKYVSDPKWGNKLTMTKRLT